MPYLLGNYELAQGMGLEYGMYRFALSVSASPFKWTFTRADLHALLTRIDANRFAPAA